MRREMKLFLALGLALSLSACKKPAAVVAKTPVPTPTAVPDKDVLGFVRGGALYAMRYDGSDVRLLARPKAGQSLWFPVPAPAGDHLLAWLSRADGTQDIVRVELSGRLTVLTEIGSRAKAPMKSLRLGNAPSYSPDGKRVAYSFNGDLWLMDANGYNAETFIADGASWAPAFSPDGKRLAYVNGTGGHYDVWMADLESRDTWQVTDMPDYTVGQPRWNKDGSELLLTRSQGEDSDIIQVSVPKDTGTVSDGDPMTRDHLSSGGAWGPGDMHLIFSSGRDGSGVWSVYSTDSLGGNAKQLTKESAFSPFWMRPSTMTASVFDSGPSRPTPVPPVAAVTAVPTAVPTPINTTVASKPAAPVAASTAAPDKPAAPAVPPKPSAPNVAAKPAATAATAPATAPAANPAISSKPAAPAAPAHAVPVATNPSAPQASAAPTQPPAKAAPLRLRLKASFDDSGKLAPAGLTELKKLAPRVAQYAGETVTVIGPQDRSPLKGKFASEESRSLARANAIAAELTKEGKLKPGSAKAQAYAPPAAGASGPPNSIQIYVELR